MTRYIKIILENGDKCKVTLDMMKLIEMCEKSGQAIDEVLKVEIYQMENDMLNNERRYHDKNKSLAVFPNDAFSTESAENEVLKNMTYKQLDYYLNDCTELQKSRFIKNKINGYTYKEIAEQENVTINTIHQSVKKAKYHFSKKINEKY